MVTCLTIILQQEQQYSSSTAQAAKQDWSTSAKSYQLLHLLSVCGGTPDKWTHHTSRKICAPVFKT